jgi:hypothetical protein
LVRVAVELDILKRQLSFNRDDVNVHELRDAVAALAQLVGWIDNYNRQAPHSPLGMRSQLFFRRSRDVMCGTSRP